MIYLKDANNNVFGFDEDQQDLIKKAIGDGMIDISDAWPPKPSFNDVQAAALARVDAYHAQQVQDLVCNTTQVEKDTWALKLETANFIINQAILTKAGDAFLTGAGLESDVDQKNWAQSVIAKSVRYATFVGVAERLRDNARTAIKAATTEEELNAALEEHRKIAEDAVAELGGS